MFLVREEATTYGGSDETLIETVRTVDEITSLSEFGFKVWTSWDVGLRGLGLSFSLRKVPA